MEQCENCGTPLKGDFCHVCGQKAVEVRRPVLGLAQDVIVETLSVDGRLLRTIFGLFTNPGRVAKRYIEGHRVQYSPPFRIYLFFSLVFFAVLFLVINGELANEGARVTTVSDGRPILEISLGDDEDEPVAEVDGTAPDVDDAQGLQSDPPKPAQDGDVGAEDNEDAEGGEDKDAFPEWEDFNYNGPAALEPFAKRLHANARLLQEDNRLFLANVKDNLPRVLLALPLLYTLLLLLFYFYKKGVFVYDLLIVSIYMHAALYFYLLLSILFQISPLNAVPILGHAEVVLQFWAVIQSYRTLKINFGSGRWSYMLKGTLINLTYWIVAALLIATGMMLSLLG
ncbi:MAG: DUF3667 domain-containing protein [Pseudomonadota bacterium]